MIEDYRFGSMTVSGVRYQSDLKIIANRVAPDWWRQESHSVDVFDVEDILAVRPQFLVVGQGQPGRMQVTESLRVTLAAAGIQLIEEPTEVAIHIFNQLHAEGKRVAAAFHLTC